jgi:Family of unknown function (DUF6200)
MSDAETTEEITPIVLKVGKRKRRVIKDLKRGRGRLMDEVEQTLEEVRVGLGAEGERKELVPVVLIYREKDKKRKGLRLF